MKKKNIYSTLIYSWVFLTVLGLALLSCEDDDYHTDSDDPGIPLTVADSSIKAPGRGQYKLKMLSGESVDLQLDLSSFNSIVSITVYKTINTEADSDFGSNGTLDLTSMATGSELVYTFTPDVNDVDQLVGLTFVVEGDKTVSSDLTLLVTLSPRDNISRKKWAWSDRLWVDDGNSVDIKDCERDNYFYFNADSTVNVDYGAETGAGDCAFDGFTVYDQWYWTEDEKYFILKSHGLFDPTPKTDSFRVKKLTTDEMQLEIDIDLTVFGLSEDETFLYEYTAEPK